MEKMILAADIGGTSSRFGLFAVRSGSLVRIKSLWLETQKFQSLEGELNELIAQGFISVPIQQLVVAGAGPVLEGRRIKLTNVPWGIDLDALPENLKPVNGVVINDFVAQALSSVSPIAAEADLLVAGETEATGVRAVLGAGTGLGVASIALDKSGRYLALPSEGGHVNYCAESEEEFRFMKFIANKLKLPYASWEDVLSGRGLAISHEFLTGDSLAPAEVGQLLAKAEQTAEFFARNYGRLCRNLALQYLATGGVYIAGGIATKNRILVEHPAFQESFYRTRQHADFLAKVPIFLIDNQESGLWGAAQLLA